jgi:hypothetical protein
VADAQNESKTAGLTRGKAIVIAVLSVVLVVILYVQFGSAGDSKSTGSKYRPPRQTRSAPNDGKLATAASEIKSPSGGQTAAAPVIDETRWKSPELATVIAYDPFALPAAFPQPASAKKGARGNAAESDAVIKAAAEDEAKKLADAVERLRTQLEELKQRGVQIIVRERDEYAAMIGDRMVHVGDEIDGFTVTHIDPTEGVYIELPRKKSP